MSRHDGDDTEVRNQMRGGIWIRGTDSKPFAAKSLNDVEPLIEVVRARLVALIRPNTHKLPICQDFGRENDPRRNGGHFRVT